MKKISFLGASVLTVGIACLLWRHSTLLTTGRATLPIQTGTAASRCAVDFLHRAGFSTSRLDLAGISTKNDRLKGQRVWIVKIPYLDASSVLSNHVVVVYETGRFCTYQRLSDGKEVEITGDLATADRRH